MDIKTIFNDALNATSIQEFINGRYQSPENTIISTKLLSHISEIIMDDGTKIYPSDYPEICDINLFSSVKYEYDNSDLRPTDRVIDIGANIGAWSVLAARKGCTVTAIEPLYYRELAKTAERNAVNIKIIRCAIGENRREILEYRKRKEEVTFRPFSEVKNEYGPFDFMKIDCEGGEWSIRPEDLAGIRCIEGELHDFHGSEKPNWDLINFIRKKYHTRINVVTLGKLWMIHARIK
ncbi:MAG: FkbM family methyltransferase [Methanoregula sp.]|nr:FkbM family methyltransferase [Methanoregula sp.]